MNPVLILTLICVPIGATMALLGKEPVAIAGIVMLSVTVLAALLQIVWFTFKDPDRLQHDRHLERMEVIRQTAIGLRDDSGVRELAVPDDSMLIENPKALPHE